MHNTSDQSNVEQSAVSVQLVHQREIEEHLLALVDSSEDQSAGGLTTIMLENLQDFGNLVPATRMSANLHCTTPCWKRLQEQQDVPG